MTPLALRPVSRALADASRLLGRGRWLEYPLRGAMARLSLSPLIEADRLASDDHAWTTLDSAQGPLHLTHADAVLSLFGEVPVVTGGPLQGWYWQYVNQHLSPPLAALLAPLEPWAQADNDHAGHFACRLAVHGADESVHARLACDAQTLVRLLDALPWQAIEQPLPEDWPLPIPLLLGELSLTLNELRSLRPGDVLLPGRAYFDCAGHGVMHLATQTWRVATGVANDTLFVQLNHEETLHDGQ
ncbi:type III secretion system protein [Pseudomonas gingeri]|uniref:Type III secretion system protein n=1 Tax=Pseudomonas gingeri TaxID=117681 RepID=A0A7Y8CJI9_9PSED|nr:type III secretion system protein [Pseudomonas gingeri]NWA02062.1 type III secretion system protein [Pseudomonas gingeri]NWA18145.1 type III secretion system protein [Pseudomonas gingeri]NWA56274.1 type III secretion system protein [Pseudomonas gingeri]NWA98852.1 type III secretion system protein [Pseudomonas gingeri]NWB04829.1 type III secretion system protein [Pseudomonas gingeri]